MKRRYYIIGAVLLLAAFLLGLDGLQLAGGRAVADTVFNDKLIGAYLTTEYINLFDAEAWLNDNAYKLAGGGDFVIENGMAYQGKLYAERTPVQDSAIRADYEYQFPVEGMACYCPIMEWESEEGPSTYINSVYTGGMEGRLAIATSDGRDEITLDGTLHVSLDAPRRSYYVNPVYQDREGNVYLQSGSGMMVGSEDGYGDEGSIWTSTIKSTVTETVDGKTLHSTNSVAISLTLVRPTERMGVVLMDGDHGILEARNYDPDAVPEELDVRGAAYIIIETYDKAGNVIERAVHGPEDETAAYFRPMENGVCEKAILSLKWE